MVFQLVLRLKVNLMDSGSLKNQIVNVGKSVKDLDIFFCW